MIKSLPSIRKPLLIITLVISTMAISFIRPTARYQSLNVLPDLDVPSRFSQWRSRDVSEKMRDQNQQYGFIGDIFARVYWNMYGESLMFLVLDAGNFHNPKVCYTSAGYFIRELEKQNLPTQNGSITANALYLEKPGDKMVMLYWLCIDKKVVGWTGQKIAEFWSSLLNKQKAGFMVRIDIPAQGRSEESCLKLAREFIATMEKVLAKENKEYLFGR